VAPGAVVVPPAPVRMRAAEPAVGRPPSETTRHLEPHRSRPTSDPGARLDAHVMAEASGADGAGVAPLWVSPPTAQQPGRRARRPGQLPSPSACRWASPGSSPHPTTDSSPGLVCPPARPVTIPIASGAASSPAMPRAVKSKPHHRRRTLP